MAVRVKMNCC